MSFAITIASCLLLIALVFNLASAAACVSMRIPVTEFGIGYGPKILQFHWRSCRFSLGALLCGGFIAFDQEAFDSRSLLRRLFVAGFGLLATIFCGFLILGISLGFHYFLGAFANLISGALDPLGAGRALVDRFANLSAASFVNALGVFFMVSSAHNLLPSRAVTGGRLLAEISRSWLPASIARVSNFVGMALFLLFTLAWAVAIVAHFL